MKQNDTPSNTIIYQYFAKNGKLVYDGIFKPYNPGNEWEGYKYPKYSRQNIEIKCM